MLVPGQLFQSVVIYLSCQWLSCFLNPCLKFDLYSCYLSFTLSCIGSCENWLKKLLAFDGIRPKEPLLNKNYFQMLSLPSHDLLHDLLRTLANNFDPRTPVVDLPLCNRVWRAYINL